MKLELKSAIVIIFLLSLVTLSTPCLSQDDRQDDRSPAEIRELLEQLRSTSFATREAANASLRKPNALPYLREGLVSEATEIAWRSANILIDLLESEDEAVASKAHETVDSVLEGNSKLARERLQLALAQRLETTIKILQDLGAIFPNDSKESVSIRIPGPGFAFDFQNPSQGWVGGDSGLRLLGFIPNIRELEFEIPLEQGQNPITSRGLEILPALTDLHRLVLPANVSDQDLIHVTDLTELRALHLWNSPSFDGTGLRHLEKLTQLEELGLAATGVEAENLVHLPELPRLEKLTLPSSASRDSGIRQIAKLRSLRTLQLDNANITNDGLKHLTELKQLEELQIQNGLITDEGLAHLASLDSLTKLTLKDCFVTLDGMRQLRERLPNLKTTCIYHRPWSDSALAAAKQLVKSGAIVKRVDDPMSRKLVTSVRLSSEDWKGTSEELQLIRELPEIDRVIIESGRVTDADFEVLQSLPNVIKAYRR